MPDKKKKKTMQAIVIIVSFVVLLLAGLSIYLNKNEEQAPQELPTVNDDLSSRKELTKSEVEDRYKGLVTSTNYEVLRAEQFNQLDTELTLFLDIKVEKQLTEDELKNIGVKAHKKITEDVKGKDGLVTVFLNVFTSKEAFDKTQKEDYKGEYVNGYIQSFVSSSKDGASATINTFTNISLTNDIENLDTSLSFDIVNANNDTTSKLVKIDVVISDGTETQINDLFQSLIAMVKESNEDIEHVSITAYTSTENYQSGKNTYEYSTLYPTNFTKRVNVQF